MTSLLFALLVPTAGAEPGTHLRTQGAELAVAVYDGKKPPLDVNEALDAYQKRRTGAAITHAAIGVVDRTWSTANEVMEIFPGGKLIAARSSGAKTVLDASFQVMFGLTALGSVQRAIEEDMSAQLNVALGRVLSKQELAKAKQKGWNAAEMETRFGITGRLAAELEKSDYLGGERKVLEARWREAADGNMQLLASEIVRSEKRITKIEERHESLRADLDEVRKDLDVVATRVKALGAAQERYADALEKVEGRLSTVESTVASHDRDLAFVKGYVWRHMTPEEQLAAIQDCAPPAECVFGQQFDAETRAQLAARLELTVALGDAQRAVSVYAQGMVQIADNLGFGGAIGKDARTSLAAASAGLGLTSGVLQGNPEAIMSGLVGLSGVFGRAPGDPAAQRHQEVISLMSGWFEHLDGTLQEIRKTQAELLEGQRKILATQVRILDKLDTMDRELTDQLGFLLRVVDAQTGEGVNKCRRLALPPVSTSAGPLASLYDPDGAWEWRVRMTNAASADWDDNHWSGKDFQECTGSLEAILTHPAKEFLLHPYLAVQSDESATVNAAASKAANKLVGQRFQQLSGLWVEVAGRNGALPGQLATLPSLPMATHVSQAARWSSGTAPDLVYNPISETSDALETLLHPPRVRELSTYAGAFHALFGAWDVDAGHLVLPGEHGAVQPLKGRALIRYAVLNTRVAIAQQGILSGVAQAPFLARALRKGTANLGDYQEIDALPEGARAIVRTNVGHALFEDLAAAAATPERQLSTVRYMAIAALDMRRSGTAQAILRPPHHVRVECSGKEGSCTFRVTVGGSEQVFPIPEPDQLRRGTPTLLPEVERLEQMRELLLDELAGYPQDPAD